LGRLDGGPVEPASVFARLVGLAIAAKIAAFVNLKENTPC
jgi:hypothetical protein